MSYISASVIKSLREAKKMTQRELGLILSVSDKTVSKWETGKGLPDISLLGPLASALGVSVAELFSGNPVQNRNRCANMKKSVFYVCPICGNVICSVGEISVSCCGTELPPLLPEEPDLEHQICASESDGEIFVTLGHEMSREHHISFIAYVADARAELVKLYPEQSAEARFARRGGGRLFAFCNRHGLFKVKI